MTNLERIQSATKEELASLLCEMFDAFSDGCVGCPATEFCHLNHKGFLDWLDKETLWDEDD